MMLVEMKMLTAPMMFLTKVTSHIINLCSGLLGEAERTLFQVFTPTECALSVYCLLSHDLSGPTNQPAMMCT